MSVTHPFFVIFGETRSGQRFRPSDWAERLAGVLAPFRPGGSVQNHLGYSPYAFPCRIGNVSCVVLDSRLREVEPLAWKFVHDFARDNDLRTEEKDYNWLMGVTKGLPEK